MEIEQGTAGSWIAGGVVALAGAAGFNQLAARRAERKHPPVGHMIHVDGIEVHYTDTGGPGDAIVLIHGNGSVLQDFLCSGVVEQLSATHRVIAFDRPGYGHTSRPRDREWTAESQARVFAAAARQLDVMRPTVVGHSWGTLVALAWAMDFPDEVHSLVLLSGYYFPTLRPDALALHIVNVPILGAVFSNALAPVQARITGPLGLKQVFSPAEVTKAFQEGMPFGLLLRPVQMRASAEDGAQMPTNAARLAKRYHELHLPITVMWGDGDKLVKQEGQSAQFVEQVPTARGAPTLNVGHMIHHSRPDAVVSAILASAQRRPRHRRSFAPRSAVAVHPVGV